MPRSRTDFSPPAFLRLAGHPPRWQLLIELAHSDRQVRELPDLLHRPQSLASYPLGHLRTARLLSIRRSSADGRGLPQPRPCPVRGTPQQCRCSAASGATARARGVMDEETYPAFQRTAAELETRIRFLLHVIKSTRLKQEVD